MYHWFLKTQSLYILRSGLESQTINSYYGALLTSLPQDPTTTPAQAQASSVAMVQVSQEVPCASEQFQ